MRRKPLRNAGIDYSADNIYFITWNTKNREMIFGLVQDGMMKNNVYGNIVQDQIVWLVNQYPYLVLHAIQTMPNHVHILIEINREIGWKEWKKRWKWENHLSGKCPFLWDGRHGVGVGRDQPLHRADLNQPLLRVDTKKFKIKPIPELMGAMKSRSSFRIRQLGILHFEWQRSYYDRVVRNFKEFQNIKNYIKRNPKDWDE